ncbi:MAG: hypothetical protein M1165_00080 [Candidatus Pacearchaeota archaeon]|nr:hypothetical protein [Candidatus Pacearchaeota archaeon]
MGYYEEKKKYEQSKTGLNKCPKIKIGIMVVKSFMGWNKTTFKSFCPVCGHTIVKKV